MGLVSLLLLSTSQADPGALDAADLDHLASVVEEQTGLFVPVHPAEAGVIEGFGIVNGEEVTSGNDNVVALAGLNFTTGEAYVFCSGSLIHDEWVLTAAHCLSGSGSIAGSGMTLAILWGQDILNVGYTRAVEWAANYMDPTYNSGAFINDAGLVQLSEPVIDVEWMVLNDAPVDSGWAGTIMTFYGFGITQDFGNNAGTKRTTQIPIQSVDEFNIITFDGGTNVCNGDSGGPSTYEGPKGPEQIGINAFVTGGCVGGTGGSTRVDNHIEWITEYVPEIAVDYDDLPQDEIVVDNDQNERAWNDLGAGHQHGYGALWEAGTPVPRGCSHTGGAAGGVALVLALAGLAGRRRG